MKPVRNWRKVLSRAWSVRFMALAAVLSAAEFALPFLAGGAPSGKLAALAAVVSLAAFGARLIAQADVSGDDA